jgi:hypothetical protein
MFLGESLLLYTDVDYNWLDSGYCGDANSLWLSNTNISNCHSVGTFP